MAISSMTGFGSAQGSAGAAEIGVEVRSVNHRFLDVNFRLPSNYSRFEQDLSRMLKAVLKRGRVDFTITRSDSVSERVATKFNEEAFRSYLEITRRAIKLAGLKERSALPVAIPQILARREVLEVGTVEKTQDDDWPIVEKLAREAIEKLSQMRAVEGATLEQELLSQLDSLSEIAKKIRLHSEKTPLQFAERLKARLDKLSEIELDPARLAQEVAVLADRIDVTEELVRLDSHISQFRQALSGADGGRKLEFLIQEIGREVNTTGSKSQNGEITVLVVEAKAVLERLREQVLNIE